MTNKCNPIDHRYFVAEVIGVPDEGTVHVLIVCTSCGDFICHTKQVSGAGAQIRLLREEKRISAQVQTKDN